GQQQQAAKQRVPKAKEFLNEIRDKYRIAIPLPPVYMTVNSMEKPELPENPDDISELHLIIPIKLAKLLVEMA
ncbi:6012_t:CDS:2, partial [Gigaspora margarita]